jgi:hypothetical protein
MEPLTNGLDAQMWLPLADVEAPLTDHVLQALAAEGIAATAVPGGSDDPAGLSPTGTAGRWTGPAYRISVDGRLRKQARGLIEALLPELRAELAQARRASEDDQWSQIVAAYEADPTATAPRRPFDDPDAGQALDGEAEASEQSSATDEWGDVQAAPAAVPVELASSDDEGHFVPPEAPPVPTGDGVTRAAWTGVIGGPLFLILATLLGWQADGLPGLLAVIAFVGGFITLITRMKDRPSLDDSGDDGAVV